MGIVSKSRICRPIFRTPERFNQTAGRDGRSCFHVAEGETLWPDTSVESGCGKSRSNRDCSLMRLSSRAPRQDPGLCPLFPMERKSSCSFSEPESAPARGQTDISMIFQEPD